MRLLDDWSLLEVRGADAADFLHGQFTNDLLSLPRDQAQLSAYCLPKGQMIANFLLWRTRDGRCRIAAPRGPDEALLQRLRMFRLRADVELERLDDALALFGVTEPGAAEESALPVALPHSPLGKAEEGPYTAVAWPGARARWLLAAPREAAAGARAPAAEAWRLRDIEDGLPFVRAGNGEQFVPQHLNLDLIHAISFDKGCYPGQEVVARMKYRGQVKFRTYRLRGDCERAPGPGAPVHLDGSPEARPCGRIVDACMPPDGGPCQMLAAIRAADAGRALRAPGPDGPLLTRLPLPYELDEAS